MIGIIFAALAFEASVQEAKVETERLQEGLTNRCSIVQYSSLVRTSGGNAVWTDALQTALREHEVVVIPASDKPYDIDRTIVVPSNRRIEAAGATIRATRDLYTVLFRNEHVADGTLRPIPSGTRDRNIAFVGGRFEDWCRRRGQNNRANRNHVDGTDCKVGNYMGVGTFLFFSNCDNLMLKGVTIARAGNFAVQSGDGRAHVYEDVTFDKCYADGLHLNGNLSDVLVRNVRGQVGDDLVALNAYDWLGSSVSFGPQRNIVCEDLRLIQTRRFHAYPALRIQPAKFRYADGSVVDCSISNIVFRKVRGIMNFKGYLQTPPYRIGEEPEWSAVGSGGNWHFEDIEINLTGPVVWSPDPLRGHYGAFELCADLTGVHLNDIRIRFRTEKYPLAHLVVVGPKSCASKRPGGMFEIFDPYASCTVRGLTLGKITTSGRVPGELVRTIAFDDINRDGRSSGRGLIVGQTNEVQAGESAALTDGSTPWKIRFTDAGGYDRVGWQRRALSFGNGYMGVSEFGDVATEKLQLSDPTFHTRQQQRGDAQGNFTDAADLFFEFGHSGAVGYSRELDPETAIVTMKYGANGVNYAREHFASYPDRVGVAHFTADRRGRCPSR